MGRRRTGAQASAKCRIGLGRLNEGEVLDPFVLPQYVWTGNEDVSPDAQYQYFLGSLTGNNLPNNPRTRYNISAE